jgi:hypothetical protein
MRFYLKYNRRELTSLRVCRDFEDVRLWKMLYNHAVQLCRHHESLYIYKYMSTFYEAYGAE